MIAMNRHARSLTGAALAALAASCAPEAGELGPAARHDPVVIASPLAPYDPCRIAAPDATFLATLAGVRVPSKVNSPDASYAWRARYECDRYVVDAAREPGCLGSDCRFLMTFVPLDELQAEGSWSYTVPGIAAADCTRLEVRNGVYSRRATETSFRFLGETVHRGVWNTTWSRCTLNRVSGPALVQLEAEALDASGTLRPVTFRFALRSTVGGVPRRVGVWLDLE